MKEIPNMEMRHLRQRETGSVMKGHLPPMANNTQCPCSLTPCVAVACRHHYPTVARRAFQVSSRSRQPASAPWLKSTAGPVVPPGGGGRLWSAAAELYERTRGDKAACWKVPPRWPVCWSSSYHCGLHHTALCKQVHGRRFTILHTWYPEYVQMQPLRLKHSDVKYGLWKSCE